MKLENIYKTQLNKLTETRNAKNIAAIKRYHELIRNNEDDVRTYVQLAKHHVYLNQYDRADETYRSALDKYPGQSILYYQFIRFLQKCGDSAEAVVIARKAKSTLSEDLLLYFVRCLLLPTFYNNQFEIQSATQKFLNGVADLAKYVSLNSVHTTKELQNAFALTRPYLYLAYQNVDDLLLRQKLGGILQQVMSTIYPQLSQAVTLQSRDLTDKVRIGYVSSQFFDHSVAKARLGWVERADPERFEIYCYHAGQRSDATTEKFKQLCYRFFHAPNDLESLVKQIIDDRLHFLIYLDLGETAVDCLAAALRLAPIQCATSALPFTSGMPTIDYFITCDTMEPQHAAQYYSEKLVLLPGIGTYYEKPIIPKALLTKTRLDFGINEDAIAYLCCQSTLKYLPQHDYIFPEIAKHVPNAVFIFTPSNPVIADKFKNRIYSAFDAYGLSGENYCLFISPVDTLRGYTLPLFDFWNLNLICDVFLDTIGWSSFITALDAIACSLPVVTYPAQFCRGRQAYAILKELDVGQTIASDEEDYIRLAVKLGLEKNWRYEIVMKIKEGQINTLFKDMRPIIALENFYKQTLKNNT